MEEERGDKRTESKFLCPALLVGGEGGKRKGGREVKKGGERDEFMIQKTKKKVKK